MNAFLEKNKTLLFQNFLIFQIMCIQINTDINILIQIFIN